MRDNFVVLNIGNFLKIFFSLLRGVHMGVYSGGLIFGRSRYIKILIFAKPNYWSRNMAIKFNIKPLGGNHLEIYA